MYLLRGSLDESGDDMSTSYLVNGALIYNRRQIITMQYTDTYINIHNHLPLRVGLVVSVSTSHTVGREFASRPGHTKHHHKNGTDCLPAWHAVQHDCLKGLVVSGTVYGDMHFKDLLGSIARVRYCIPVPDFYLVLNGL